ncbi:MAG: YqgE/AlgH family protein [Betaproteobacteria bacterium]|nr:YqgE/AlgH family protein [Betaproteobacteria bacterium]
MMKRACVALLALSLAVPVPAAAAESVANSVFLVARRGMPDPNFRETVVLVTHPQRGVPFGVIINRPLDHRLSEVFTDHESLKGRKDVIYFGGPVARDGLVFLVRAAKPPARAISVLKDVYFTADSDLVDELLKRPDPTQGLRVFAGYSGWGPGQLQHEISRGDWHILPADAETVFEREHSRIWPELIDRATIRRTRHSARP